MPNHQTTCPTNRLPKEFPISLWHDHERSVLVAFDFTGGKGLLPKGECEKPPFWVSRCFKWWSSKNIMNKIALKGRYTDFCVNKMTRSYLYLFVCIFIYMIIQFVSLLVLSICYIMLCIVFWCKWFPMAHGSSLVPLKLWHWSAIRALEANAKSLQSRRFAALLSRHWTCFGAGEVWIKGFHKSLIFRRGLLGNVSWRKATDVQRLLIMPISIWSIPVFKIHFTAREGNLKGTNIGVSGGPGVLTGSFDALRWLLGQRRSLGSLRGDSCGEDVASCLASRKVGSTGGHFWTFGMKGCDKFHHFHFGSMFILFVSFGAGSK